MMKKIRFSVLLLVYSIALFSINACSTFVRVHQIQHQALNYPYDDFIDFIFDYITNTKSLKSNEYIFVFKNDFGDNREYNDIHDECLEEIGDRYTLYTSSINNVFIMNVTRGEKRYYCFFIITDGMYNTRTKELSSYTYKFAIVKLL